MECFRYFRDGPVPPDAMPNASDELPQLHELTLGSDGDHWRVDRHCRILWTRCFDFSQLQNLDLRYGCLETLLEQLTGLLPKLRSLTLGINIDPPDNEFYGDGGSSPVQSFIESIHSLRDLYIINRCAEPDFLFPPILTLHESLETFSFHTPPNTNFVRKVPPGWTANQIMEVYDCCKDLSRLELDVRLNDGHWVSTSQRGMEVVPLIRW